MSEQNTGGPAFPTGIFTDDKGMIVGGGFGMTLRDYFAAKAMQGMVASPEYAKGDWPIVEIANQSYEMADAMLKVRQR